MSIQNLVRGRTCVVVPSVVRGYAVVAKLRSGRELMVCLAASRDEAVQRACAAAAEFSGRAARLGLRRWAGEPDCGRWVVEGCRRGEMPRLGRRRVG